MEKLKYAIIGCGRIAPSHFKAYLSNKNNLELAAICDILPEAMESFLCSCNLSDDEKAAVHRYTDHHEMLKNEKLDLAAVSAISGAHAGLALDCMDYGCNVIVEKPIALSIADADKMIAKAKEKGVLLCTCHQNRFNPAIQKIHEAKEGGRFGRLLYGTVHVRWSRDRDYFDSADWRGTWAQDGGALMNQCIHGIDLLRWMFDDEIDEVFAYTANQNHPYIEAEDIGVALVRFKNGCVGTIEGTTNVYSKNLEETLYVFGDKGTAKAGGIAVNKIDEWNFADGLDNPDEVKAGAFEAPMNSVYGAGHSAVYADMISAIKNNRQPYISGEAGKRALELVLAIYQSAKEHRPVKLPLGNFSTLDMQGFFN